MIEIYLHEFAIHYRSHGYWNFSILEISQEWAEPIASSFVPEGHRSTSHCRASEPTFAIQDQAEISSFSGLFRRFVDATAGYLKNAKTSFAIFWVFLGMGISYVNLSAMLEDLPKLAYLLLVSHLFLKWSISLQVILMKQGTYTNQQNENRQSSKTLPFAREDIRKFPGG